jgi:hypothetical protein
MESNIKMAVGIQRNNELQLLIQFLHSGNHDLMLVPCKTVAIQES